MNKQKTKFLCDICNRVFLQEQRYLAHRNTHNLLLFECRECLEQFADREKFLEHQNQTNHNGEGRIESVNVIHQMISINIINLIFLDHFR